MSVIVMNMEEAKECYEEIVSELFVDDAILLLPSSSIARKLDRLFDTVFDKIVEEEVDSFSDVELCVYNLLITVLNKFESFGIIIRVYLLDKYGNILIHVEDI